MSLLAWSYEIGLINTIMIHKQSVPDPKIYQAKGNLYWSWDINWLAQWSASPPGMTVEQTPSPTTHKKLQNDFIV